MIRGGDGGASARSGCCGLLTRAGSAARGRSSGMASCFPLRSGEPGRACPQAMAPYADLTTPSPVPTASIRHGSESTISTNRLVASEILPLGLEPVPINANPGPEYSAAQLDYAMVIGLDRTPKGRNEKGVWWRRHDEYS